MYQLSNKNREAILDYLSILKEKVQPIPGERMNNKDYNFDRMLSIFIKKIHRLKQIK